MRSNEIRYGNLFLSIFILERKFFEEVWPAAHNQKECGRGRPDASDWLGNIGSMVPHVDLNSHGSLERGHSKIFTSLPYERVEQKIRLHQWHWQGEHTGALCPHRPDYSEQIYTKGTELLAFRPRPGEKFPCQKRKSQEPKPGGNIRMAERLPTCSRQEHTQRQNSQNTK